MASDTLPVLSRPDFPQFAEDAIEFEIRRVARIVERYMQSPVNQEQPERKPKLERVKLVCNECGRKFSVSPNASDPSCPKCGGVDWDVIDETEVNRG